MKPIERISVTDMTVQNLKELIISGNIKIGDKLPTEMEICSALNISRSTVREAIRVLQAMGFVEMKRGKGAFVAKVTEDDPTHIIKWFVEHEVQVTDFMEVRMGIEPLGVKLAIQRATPKQISELEEIHANFEKAMEGQDVVALLTNDEAFHKHIIKATQNNLLISINQQILDVFAEYRSKSFTIKEISKNALEPHRKVLDAIKRRDIDAGVEEMAKHINGSIEDMLDMAKKMSVHNKTLYKQLYPQLSKTLSSLVK
ncbi:FadR/GntR family transcriptional regulator [Petroclostridium sp. X23]|jgi:GntR family transcriptional repressor for pyruvate dehydrogenase complex|uniref:FadR/GntR family transcriptional regulator n=1 Tax=Petroclostridium sp. X23 TaxID=3045146 RepID=UPI0024AE3E10|nr:FadR/GntR family transcriptional regulator [Petroclostridium sp. X23]WHH58026.1 FadR/GntR family transcriptional regulator [Petroclostridium sp. X23]